MPTKIDFLLAKVLAFEKPLEKLDQASKTTNVPIELAQNFNRLLDEINSQSPEASPELPAPIALSGDWRDMGFSEISYVTLEIMVGQVLGVLGVLKAGQ